MKKNTKSKIKFLSAQEISYKPINEETLPPHVLKGIANGQADIKAGRIITLEEFKKRLSSVR